MPSSREQTAALSTLGGQRLHDLPPEDLQVRRRAAVVLERLAAS